MSYPYGSSPWTYETAETLGLKEEQQVRQWAFTNELMKSMIQPILCSTFDLCHAQWVKFSRHKGEQRTGLQEAEEKSILCAPPADGAQVHLPANHSCSSQASSSKHTNSHRWSSPEESLSPVLSEWFWRGWVVPSAAHTILQFHQ